MIKSLIAPVVALLVVVSGLGFLGTNYEFLAKESEAEQVYFLKHVPEANMVVVEPNYGRFYHPNPDIQGDSSGEFLYDSLDSLAHTYEIKRTEMVRFERKGEMIPNLYVFVDAPRDESMAEMLRDNQDEIAENLEL
ncbi:MAG: hypothetical protein AAFU84_08375 [Cyanobacteria bacterium J06633_23]